MENITDKQRLDIIERLLVESGAGEDVLMDVIRNQKRTDTEVELANMVSTIYKIVHLAGDCKNHHQEWQEEINTIKP